MGLDNPYEQFCKASCQCIRCALLINEAPNQEHGYQQRCRASGLNVTFQLNKRFYESCPVFIDTNQKSPQVQRSEMLQCM